jgi:hypothetical protein
MLMQVLQVHRLEVRHQVHQVLVEVPALHLEVLIFQFQQDLFVEVGGLA